MNCIATDRIRYRASATWFGINPINPPSGIGHRARRGLRPHIRQARVMVAFDGLDDRSAPGDWDMKRAVERARLQQEPYLVWNAFIDLLAMEEYGDLTAVQRKAHLVFWYDSEVQNGGHGQYFENRGVNTLAETVAALRDLGLPCQAQVLSRAVTAFAAAEPGTAWEDALHDTVIDELDDRFHRCTPAVTEALERHLASHANEYVVEK